MTYKYRAQSDVQRRDKYHAQSAALMDTALQRQDLVVQGDLPVS